MNPTYLAHPENLTATDIAMLDEAIAKYPYCATYKLLRSVALANVHSTQLSSSVKQTAVYMHDRSRLFHLVSNGEYDWVSLMDTIEKKRAQSDDSIDDFLLIDQYLDHLHLPSAHNSESTESQSPNRERIAEPSSTYDLSSIQASTDDYFDDEETIENTEEDDTFSLIDSFLSAEAEGQLFTPIAPEKKSEENAEDELEKIRDRAILSESLAKVYVKQHKYEQALAIFSSLNLQFSKKNSYFADQIRFLEKVIAYQKESNEEK